MSQDEIEKAMKRILDECSSVVKNPLASAEVRTVAAAVCLLAVVVDAVRKGA